jgi:MTH538 TIR-like domain (DUF1863)
MAQQAPRAFISFDFDNNYTLKELFAGQAKLSKTPFEIADWSSKDSLPQTQWETLISEKISKCHLMIVLVGKQMATATGADKEIAMALKHNVPFFGVYVDGASTGHSLPKGLAQNRTISWTWEGIANAITQMMGEGKNKT